MGRQEMQFFVVRGSLFIVHRKAGDRRFMVHGSWFMERQEMQFVIVMIHG
jgi:hypothetical protein